MSWNYRVMQRDDGSGVLTFAIVEAYYGNDKSQGKPHSYTTGDASPVGESIDELKADMERMSQALARPVLSPSDFKYE